ncbi:hypothetical protein CapIbe_005965 [Capra ibex]
MGAVPLAVVLNIKTATVWTGNTPAQEKMVSSKEKKKMTSSSTKHGCTYCDLWSGSSHPGATRRMCLRPEARAQRREDPVVLHFTERL